MMVVPACTFCPGRTRISSPCSLRERQFGARAKLDHPALTASWQVFSRPDPTHDPSRNGAGNLPHAQCPHRTCCRFQPQFQRLVLLCGRRAERIEEFAAPVCQSDHSTFHRHTVQVYVEHRQKNVDYHRRPPQIIVMIHLAYGKHLPVGWRHHHTGLRGNRTQWITEEVHHECR